MTKSAFGFGSLLLASSDRSAWRRTITKTLLVMKLTILLLTVAFLNVQGKTTAQLVTFSGKEIPLQQVFSTIEQQTGHVVFYNKQLLSSTKSVTLTVRDMPLRKFLETVLEDQPISYLIKQKNIFLSRKPEVSTAVLLDNASGSMLIPAFINIKGKVVDEGGTPLSGVSVVLKRTKNGTSTDASGNFSINAEAGDVLEFTFIGYEKQVYTIKDNSTIALIKMKVANNKLDEVIYTAYGKTSKRLNTGDITKVSGEDIANVPVLNPLLALEGRVPGLIISKNGGYASSPVKTTLRGQLNVNPNISAEPLFVIDGVPLIVPSVNAASLGTGYDQGNQIYLNSPAKGMSPLFMIQSLDIESIEILKDADALSLYGAQAANGAILITTKKAKPGHLSLNLALNKGITKAATGTEYLSTPDYLEMRKAAFRNAGLGPTAASAPELVLWNSIRSTNWLKELYGGTGIFDNMVFTASGGQRGLTYRVGGSYSKQTEVASVGGSTKRFTLNSALDYTGIGNRFKASLSTTISQARVNLIQDVTDFGLPPNAPPIYDSLNQYNWAGWAAGQNSRFLKFPYLFGAREVLNPSTTKVFTINGRLSYSIFKQLEMSVDIQKADNTHESNSFTPIKSKNPTGTTPTGTANFSSSGGQRFNVSPQLKFYTKKNWGNISILSGFNYNSASSWNQALYGSGYTNDDLLRTIAGAATVRGETRQVMQRTVRLFSTLNYNFQNKYVVNLNASREGSTKFGPGKKFGTFWSVGAAWILSDESWVKNSLPEAISFLKLRGSYGTTGGDGVGDFQYLRLWGAGFSSIKPYGGVAGINPLHAINPEFHWQTSRKRSFSLDIGLFNNRINLGVTNYADRMSDQLVQFPIAITTGFDMVVANYPALTQNSGWEMIISSDIIKTKNLVWMQSFNLSLNKNKLVAYPGIENSPYRNTLVVGQSLNSVPVLHYTGVDALTGVATYLDLNDDGVIKGGIAGESPHNPDDDRIWLNLTPKFSGGAQSNFKYKNWSASFSFSYFNAIIKDPLYSSIDLNGRNIPKIIWDNTWKNPGDRARFPRVTAAGTGIPFSNTDAGYTDAFYATLNNMALNYKIQSKWLTRLSIKGANIGVSTNDIFSVALKGYYRPNAVALDRPLTRTISFSFNANF